MFVLLLSSIFVVNVKGDQAYKLQVGARGDDGSKGNKGVSVEIQTHIYNTNQGDFQSFWVADNLDNGAFIQFGYLYEPGYFCLKDQLANGKWTCSGNSDNIGNSDARWFWQYWPDRNGDDFSVEIGPANSAGTDMSWHRYSIQPNTAGRWSFLLDGREVSHIAVRWTRSNDVALFAAEKGSDTKTFSRLGPVGFRNLTYLQDDGWHPVAALYAYVGCGVGTDCNVNNPYGVRWEDSGVVTTGSGIHRPNDGDLMMGMLTLDLPPQVRVLVDRKISVAASSQLPLSPGLHTITIPSLVTVDNESRLRFDQWSDGVKSTNRTITMKSETTLKATYATQYVLVVDSVVPIKIAGWYDEGSTVPLPATVPIHADLGIIGGQWAFDGGYEDGSPLASSTKVSIVMDRSHALELRWHQDYTIPIAIVASLVLVALVAAVIVKRRSSKSE